MKTFVNKDVCIGCGACTVIADKIFEFGDDGLAEVKEEYTDDIPDTEIDNVRDACEGCPVGAIKINED